MCIYLYMYKSYIFRLIYFLERKSVGAGRGAEGEREFSDSLLSAEPDTGLDPTPPKS